MQQCQPTQTTNLIVAVEACTSNVNKKACWGACLVYAAVKTLTMTVIWDVTVADSLCKPGLLSSHRAVLQYISMNVALQTACSIHSEVVIQYKQPHVTRSSKLKLMQTWQSARSWTCRQATISAIHNHSHRILQRTWHHSLLTYFKKGTQEH